MQEDPLTGQIYGFLETYQGNRVCSLLLYREALHRGHGKPNSKDIREIRETISYGIEKGTLKGWRKYEGPRLFAQYGKQRGWERIPITEH
jgi:hypothetical protein